MKLKTVDVNGVTYAEVKDGKPIFLGENDREIEFDAPTTIAKITALNAEARSHREAKEKAEAALKAFEGLTDPAAAIKALETVKNLKEGDLVQAGKVEEIKAAAARAADEQARAAAKAHADEIAKKTAELEAITGRYHGEKIAGLFAGSKFINEKIAVPPDMIRATFGGQFRVDNDGKVVAYDATGAKIYSLKNGGVDTADFEEALEMMVGSYAHRDSILKGSGAQGSGARPSNGAGNGMAKTIPRSQFAKLDPTTQMKTITEDGVTVVDG